MPRIAAIEYHLPEKTLSNDDLVREFPDWSVDKIESKTGIRVRHIAADGECASDLGVKAAGKLFDAGAAAPDDIDFVLFCTQSPDYFLPTTACVVQHRLGIPTSAGALDFNLGCSGFVYGLSLANGLIETGQARNVLLITAETYSKFIDPHDRSVRTIFGDAAAATLVSAHSDKATGDIGPFVFGTDGAGAENLIVRAGAMREPQPHAPGGRNLFMSGPEIFAFTMRVVPPMIDALLKRAGMTLDDTDYYVFHQANEYMLAHLRKKIGIPQERFCIDLAECGNTVSATIPIALKRAAVAGRIKPGANVMLVGFGVGYSWGAAIVRWADI